MEYSALDIANKGFRFISSGSEINFSHYGAFGRGKSGIINRNICSGILRIDERLNRDYHLPNQILRR